MIDFDTPNGRQAQSLLASENVIWLTTVDHQLIPHPLPVWFLAEGDGVLIYSKPAASKVEDLRQHPYVSLNFNSDFIGRNPMLVFTGVADLKAEKRLAHEVPAYLAKYAQGIHALGMTPEAFAQLHAQPIKVSFETLIGW